MTFSANLCQGWQVSAIIGSLKHPGRNSFVPVFTNTLFIKLSDVTDKHAHFYKTDLKGTPYVKHVDRIKCRHTLSHQNSYYTFVF